MREFPTLREASLEAIKAVLDYIIRARSDDIADYNNLTERFVRGRKVGKVPSGSTDVTDGDKVGDFNVTASYAYYLVDNGGTAAWRRVAVGSW